MSKISKKKNSRKFPFKDVTLCLNGELVEERDRVQQKLNQELVKTVGDKRLRSSAGADERVRLDQIEAAMREDSITIRITGVDFGTYNTMLAANPPREGHEEETFNPSTFFLYAAKRTGKSLEDDGTLEEITPEEWEWVESNLTDGEHDRLASAVVQVNRTAGARGVDFLSRSSDETNSSDEISE